MNAEVNEFTEVQADIQQKFFDTLTHDLRTPLAVARMNAQVTLKRGGLAEPAIAVFNKSHWDVASMNKVIRQGSIRQND